jgi:DNA polymerase-4/DNA polymerase V
MARQGENLYLHADGDSFFVACELVSRPELRGKPVVVGADRGIAVAMSPEAKALGITRGMPVFKIKKLFPKVTILPHNFELYEDISKKMYEILSSYLQEVEAYSIDECFALVEPWEVGYFKNEIELVSEIKKEIETKLGVTYSFGLARTKALSKLASKLEKPKGVVILLSKEAETKALKATSIRDIWGIGWRTAPKLERLGMKSAYDFVNYPPEKIERSFSQPVLILKKELAGEAILEVESSRDPRDQKSIQSTATFRPSSIDPEVIEREISENAEHACKEARALRLSAGKVAFFIKTSDFKYRFDEIKLPQYTSDPGKILNAIEPRLKKLLARKEKIRSTGVILLQLLRQEKVPMDLFGLQGGASKVEKIEEVADRIRDRFGSDAIKRASSLGRNHTKKRQNSSSFKKIK